MTQTKRNYGIIIILTILIVPSIAYLIVSSGKNNYSTLEIFGPKEAGSQPGDTVYHTIAPFELDGHNGQKFSSSSLDGKIYVADFFFATCQTICPKMNMQMKRVQEAFKDDPEVLLVSFTVNPEKDTVEALAAYAQQYGAIVGKWTFLTGNKETIYELARKSYFITAMQGDGKEDDFIHSEKVVLIDKEKRIRGFYDGTDYTDIDLLKEDIKVLQYEYKNKK